MELEANEDACSSSTLTRAGEWRWAAARVKKTTAWVMSDSLTAEDVEERMASASSTERIAGNCRTGLIIVSEGEEVVEEEDTSGCSADVFIGRREEEEEEEGRKFPSRCEDDEAYGAIETLKEWEEEAGAINGEENGEKGVEEAEEGTEDSAEDEEETDENNGADGACSDLLYWLGIAVDKFDGGGGGAENSDSMAWHSLSCSAC